MENLNKKAVKRDIKRKEAKGIGNSIAKVIIIFLAIINLFPLYWMVSNSLMQQQFTFKVPPDLYPKHPTLVNYVDLFIKHDAIRWTLNSIIISVCSTVLVCIFSSMAGYAFAKKHFWGRDVIFAVCIASLMIPNQVLLVPLFKLMYNFNMVDTYRGLFLPSVALPFGLFLMKQFISTIPNELLEAAEIDGSKEMRTFFTIVLPLAKPGIGALAIFNFVKVWNDYVWQLIVTRTDKMKALQIGIASLQMERVPNVGLLMAGAVVAALPMTIIFLTFQKNFTKGITMGAVKG